MENNFVEEVKLKSIDELKEIVVNFYMYRGSLAAAAKQELANRGVELSDAEKLIIEEKKNKRRQETRESVDTNKNWDSFSVKWKANIVDDVNAPQLYSRQVLNIFSILFSVLFGGILLAINLKTVNNKKGIFPVLGFSVLYTGLMAFIINLIPGSTTPLTVAFNLLGALVLYNFFWGRYIGKEFQYRTKPFWKPLIIAIIIFSFILWVIIP
ncbi:MAG: hypothetical protein WCJ03_04565 [Bacteroidales bacterium]